MSFTEDRSVLTRQAPPPDAVVLYGELPEQIADVRFGKNSAARKPLIIIIHGGFWRSTIDRMHTGPMSTAIANAGWTNASIEYRRIPGDPQSTVRDVRDAIAKLPALVGNHNGKVIVTGHSAGGHLCLYVASVSANVAGALALAAAADLQMAEQLNLGDGAAKAFLGTAAAQHQDIDPVRLPSPRCATTIIHGMQDAIVPIALADSYAAKHSATRVVRIENCGHFAVIDPLSATWPAVIDALSHLS
ncbi:MAG TPA: alpha/beta hydrolase [Steroidobacteraceae bacterium]|nr:alpha/beta hydrolase [Steroidobacteraceae bacterium]